MVIMRRLLFVLFALAACTDEEPINADAAVARDLGVVAHPDAATFADAEPADAGAEFEDAAVSPDAAVFPDAAVIDHRGTCEVNGDCASNSCLRVPDDEDGWYTCSGFYGFEVKFCDVGVVGCCSSIDCTEGQNPKCYPGPLWYCGGAHPIAQNACVYDECASDADCTAGDVGLCIPWLAFNEQGTRCSYGDCRYDRDCDSRAGGRCMPFFEPCNTRLSAFFCTYDDSACRTDEDCSSINGGYCAPGTDGASSCMMFIPPP